MQRGFDDAKANGIDPVLGTADTAEGREYRDGHRQARRDAFDGDLLESETVFVPKGDPLAGVREIRPGWRDPSEAPDNGTPCDIILGNGEDTIYTAKRTPEGWEVATRVAGTEKHVWHRILPPDCWRPMAFAEQKGTSAAIPEQITPGINPAPYLRGAWDEPQAGAKKKRKPKPTDSDQLPLL